MTAAAARTSARLVVALVALRVMLPLVLLDPFWEFHRDELLYFAMGDHLDWRMQFPPFIALVARGGVALFGDAVWAARVPAALGGGALTAVVLLIVRRLGGGTFALWCAWVAMLSAPVFVRPSVLMQPVIFDQLWAALAVAALVLAAHEERPSWWLVVGAALGMGLLTKATAAVYGGLIFAVALAHPRLRPQLGTRWPWIAAALAIALGLPSLLGQIHHDWPFFAQLAVLERTQLTHTSALSTLAGQILMLGSGAVLVGAGLAACVRRRAPVADADESGAHVARAAAKPDLVVSAQVAALFAAALLVTILLRAGKEYYAAPGYPILLALGAVQLGTSLALRAKAVLLVGVGAVGLALLPMGIPLLGPEPMVRYAAAIGVGTTTNSGGSLALPQDFADMIGWRAEAEAMSAAYSALSTAEQASTVIAGGNYGQTGALAIYRHRFGLPYPVSSAGDFHAWGPGDRSGEVLLVAASPDALADLEALYGEVRVVSRLVDPRRVSEEQEVHIIVGRHPRRPLTSAWPAIGPEWD